MVKEECSVGELTATIKAACGADLEQIALFDVYKGEQIEKGYKSVAFSLRFRSLEKTLGETEINALVNAATEKVKAVYGAVLR